MVSPTIDPQRGRAGIGFEIAGIGKAGISIGADSIGGKLGVGPVSVGVGTGSASGFESLEWDFGVAKQKTTQTGCTITRESWIVGVGVTESETWTDPRCELPPTPTPTPTTPTPAIYPPPVPLNPITSFPVGACVYYDRHFYGLGRNLLLDTIGVATQTAMLIQRMVTQARWRLIQA
ncbi:MAG: hypothetical protein EAZ69_06140 [Oscillatoriales cyanobacterium]|nr:MAG: hypothetical protein EAZ69_06140 [Oscillatoriales cyanobacterium]